MAKTPAQRGPFGNWLKRVREERYKTQADALAAMRRLAGIAISPSEYSQWEAGSRTPRPDNPKVARLYEFFGSSPTEALEATETGDNGQAALIAALAAQTAAITSLVEELRLARLAPTPDPEDVAEILELARRSASLHRADDPADHEGVPPSRLHPETEGLAGDHHATRRP